MHDGICQRSGIYQKQPLLKYKSSIDKLPFFGNKSDNLWILFSDG